MKRFSFDLSTENLFELQGVEWILESYKEESKAKEEDLDKLFLPDYLNKVPKEIRAMDTEEIEIALEQEKIEINFKKDHRKMANLLINRLIVRNGTDEQLNKLQKAKIVEILAQEKVKFNAKKTAKVKRKKIFFSAQKKKKKFLLVGTVGCFKGIRFKI